nr:MAG TPA: hypothetical protein [Caudoviricetes sp.]
MTSGSLSSCNEAFYLSCRHLVPSCPVPIYNPKERESIIEILLD